MSYRKNQTVQLNNLKDWLAKLNLKVQPTITINPSYHSAVIVVDFGNPLEPVKLAPEQFTEFSKLIKAATKEAINRDTSVRLSVDNGVHWTSV